MLECLQWKGGKSFLWQVIFLSITVVFIAGLHFNNDGLWYQGDSSRHAANGLFWWDFLSSLSGHPVQFSLSYYARYPVIHPTGYPPLFYLIEGTVFQIFGASPFVAKGLVLVFALLAGFYTIVWLRRWISEEVGWGGALLILQPGVIKWANAVMLNIPSMALGLAMMYHARRWIETSSSRHLYLTAIFGVCGILTYVQTAILLFVILAWIIIERRWMVLWDRRVLIVGLLSALVLLPWAIVATQWAPAHLGSVSPPLGSIFNLPRWTFYLESMTRNFTVTLLILAIWGVAVSFYDWRWKREVKLAGIWIIVCYFSLSYIRVKDARYALLFIPPVVFLCCTSLVSLFQWGAIRKKKDPPRFIFVGMVALVIFHFLMAPLVSVPRLQGFKDVVEFIEKVAPEDRIFYDGRFSNVFTFYIRSRDYNFKRGVVLGNKLLYASSITMGFNLIEKVFSTEDVVEKFREKCGCKWLVIEKEGVSAYVPAARFLRQALSKAEFEFVISFPIIEGTSTTQIDVYRFRTPQKKPSEIDLSFPAFGKKSEFHVKPIEKSSKGFKW